MMNQNLQVKTALHAFRQFSQWYEENSKGLHIPKQFFPMQPLLIDLFH